MKVARVKAQSMASHNSTVARASRGSILLFVGIGIKILHLTFFWFARSYRLQCVVPSVFWRKPTIPSKIWFYAWHQFCDSTVCTQYIAHEICSYCTFHTTWISNRLDQVTFLGLVNRITADRWNTFGVVFWASSNMCIFTTVRPTWGRTKFIRLSAKYSESVKFLLGLRGLSHSETERYGAFPILELAAEALRFKQQYFDSHGGFHHYTRRIAFYLLIWPWSKDIFILAKVILKTGTVKITVHVMLLLAVRIFPELCTLESSRRSAHFVLASIVFGSFQTVPFDIDRNSVLWNVIIKSSGESSLFAFGMYQFSIFKLIFWEISRPVSERSPRFVAVLWKSISEYVFVIPC